MGAARVSRRRARRKARGATRRACSPPRASFILHQSHAPSPAQEQRPAGCSTASAWVRISGLMSRGASLSLFMSWVSWLGRTNRHSGSGGAARDAATVWGGAASRAAPLSVQHPRGPSRRAETLDRRYLHGNRSRASRSFDTSFFTARHRGADTPNKLFVGCPEQLHVTQSRVGPVMYVETLRRVTKLTTILGGFES